MLILHPQQLYFTKYASKLFRHAFLLNYHLSFKSSLDTCHDNFNINTFSKYIHPKNIFEICALLDESYYALNRRSAANSKILFLDLSFSMGKLLHKKT